MRKSIRKIENRMIVALLSVLIALSLLVGNGVLAATISEHDRQDMALQKAIQLCMDKGGKFRWSMPQRYRLDDAENGYRIIGNELLIVCEIPQASGPSKWKLTWKAPTTRANGAALPANQIAGYQVLKGETLLAMVPGTEYITEPMQSISDIGLRTVDTEGRLSAVVSVEVR